MSTVKNQKKTKKSEKIRKIDDQNIFLSLLGVDVQSGKAINNKQFDLFCSGNETQKADLRAILIQKGCITRNLVLRKGRFANHEYSITQKGIDYIKGSTYYKQFNIKDGYRKNKVKFPLIAIMNALKGRSIETKLQALFYFFSSDTYKKNVNKLTDKFFFDQRIPTKEEYESKEYRNIRDRFKVIMSLIPLKSKTQFSKETKTIKTKVSGTTIDIPKGIFYNRLNKTKLEKKITTKAKQTFIQMFISCCFFKQVQKSKFLSFTPFVQKTKTVLKNVFGGIPLRKIFKKHLALIEKNPTNQQVSYSLTICDKYLNMGAIVENERCLRILKRQSQKMSESEKMLYASCGYSNNGLSQYLVDNLKKKPVLQNKVHSILEISHKISYELSEDEPPEYTEDEIMQMML